MAGGGGLRSGSGGGGLRSGRGGLRSCNGTNSRSSVKISRPFAVATANTW